MESWSLLEEKGQETGSVLLIESDPDMARAMESELLRGGFRVRIARSHLSALGMMEDLREPHVLLVPADSTDIDGFDFVHLVRHRNRFLKQSLRIIMAGSGENFSRISRNDNGIDDYLLHPYFSGELVWRVRKAWQILESQRLTASRDHMDASSGILTTTGIKRILHEELNKSFRKQACFSLAVIVFHRLDEVHVNYGRMLGEWMERDVSLHIKRSLRSYDRLGRLDVGKYCLVAPDIDREHLGMLLHRLGQQVQEWNESVAKDSHLRTPLEPNVRGVAVYPKFQPEHVTKAVSLLWDWINQEGGLVDIARAEFYDLVMTAEAVALQKCLPETTPDMQPADLRSVQS